MKCVLCVGVKLGEVSWRCRGGERERALPCSGVCARALLSIPPFFCVSLKSELHTHTPPVTHMGALPDTIAPRRRAHGSHSPPHSPRASVLKAQNAAWGRGERARACAKTGGGVRGERGGGDPVKEKGEGRGGKGKKKDSRAAAPPWGTGAAAPHTFTGAAGAASGRTRGKRGK